MWSLEFVVSRHLNIFPGGLKTVIFYNMRTVTLWPLQIVVHSNVNDNIAWNLHIIISMILKSDAWWRLKDTLLCAFQSE